MKLTSKKLKQLIKEELDAMTEQPEQVDESAALMVAVPAVMTIASVIAGLVKRKEDKAAEALAAAMAKAKEREMEALAKKARELERAAAAGRVKDEIASLERFHGMAPGAIERGESPFGE